MAEVLFEIPEWLDYADYDNYPSESKPTTNADFINYSRNQNKLVGALTSAFLWQPNTNFTAGKIIITPNMPEGMEAIVTTAGTSGNTEPKWVANTTLYQDGGVKWQLRYRHYSKSIATQSEAEAGTDNTKVMTPLMVAKSKLRYKSLGELGLSDSANWQEIANALLNKSIDGAVLWTYINLNILSNLATLTPPSGSYNQGFLKVETRKGSCFVEILWYNSWRRDIGQLYADVSTPYWKQLATNGALSMPSGNKVRVSHSGFTAYSKEYQTIVDGYTAPCDGYLTILAETYDVTDVGGVVSLNNDSASIANRLVFNKATTVRTFVPANKGQKLTVQTRSLAAIYSLNFVYAQSEV